jgi:hypothetical protein
MASEFNIVEQSGDFWMRLAQEEILESYGDYVRIKPKSLVKFGRTANADNGVKTTVGVFQDAIVNETFATTNSVDYVVSTSASDTGPVTIEGHTQDQTTGDFVFVVQTVTMTGTTPVALTTPMARANRAYVKAGTYASPASANVGDIAVYDSTLSGGGVTAGKPDVDAAVKLMIAAGVNQSEKCATTISSSEYWIITGLNAEISRSGPQSALADITLEYRVVGGVWRPLGVEISISKDSVNVIAESYSPAFIIPKNSDVRLVATSTVDNSIISGAIRGVLAVIH